MKLHLPVQLFRAVIALMAVAMPFSASAARKYTVADGQQLTLSGLDELDLDISGYNGSSSSGSAYGGAIYATGTGSVTLEHYVNLLFNKNYASSSSLTYGGAIHSDSGAITLSGNESITFSNNYAGSSSSSSYGGAIYSARGAITLSGNGSVTFSGNYSTSSSSSSSSYGGAIYSSSSSGAITLSGNGSVTFSGNHARHGGAIYSSSSSGDITLSGNESVTFSGNYASSSSYGGAICGYGAITLSGNESVTFSDNYASTTSSSTTSSSTTSSLSSARGGAIYSDSGDITLSGNESVTFSGNYATSSSSSFKVYAYGGAIYSDSGDITLSGNGSVTFSGNYASTTISSYDDGVYDDGVYGGAIYGKNINIRDNGSVVFKQNYEKVGSTYRLRGLYATGNTALSAASENYIEFQESVYVGGVLKLNNLYSVAQTGDIIFTGGYAAEYLGAIKSDYTAEELNNSRTSNVAGMTTLYDGRLIVRDGAILSGAGLTVASSASRYSTPTVLIENAKLNHAGATVSFAYGTRLEANGQSEIGCSNLTMGSGSALTLHAAGGNMSAAVLSVYGSFTMGDSLTLNISFNDDTAEAGNYRLMSVTSFDNASNWTTDKVTVNGLDGFVVNFDALYWENNTLWLKFDGEAGYGQAPPLTEATWSNLSGTHEWDMSDMNWKQDKYPYAYTDGVAVVFGDTAAGGVVLVGELAPDSVLVNNSEGYDYTWEGDPTKGGSLTGNMSLTKKGDGSLSIYTDNSYLGDTVIEGGKLVVGSADALGKGTVRLMGGMLEVATNDFDNLITAGGTAEIMVQQGSTLKLKRKIYNTEGILTLKGTIDVSALESVHIDAALVDVNGEIGTSGFARAAATGVQLVQGGMVEAAGATVLYNGEVLQVDTTGFGATIPTIDYSVYSINGRHSVATSAINAQAGAALTCIELNSGTLTADTAVSNLKALGGTLLMPQQVTVNGSVQDTLVYASAGQLNATLSGGSAVQVSGAVSISGNNTHTGGTILNNGSLTVTNSKALGTGSIITQGSSSIKANAALTLTEAIINTGTLTLSGCYNVSALELIGSGSVRVDVTGNTGASGFLKSGGSRVLVVAGGTVVNNGATVTYNGTNLTLGSDGYATMGSTGIDYSEYLLTGTDTVATSAIHSGAGAGAVIRQQGGTLTVNDMAEVNATGGSIILSSGVLSGTVSNAQVKATGGTLSAKLSGVASLAASGTLSITGANTHSGGTSFSGGNFTLAHGAALGNGLVVMAGTNTLAATTVVTLNDRIINNGALTMTGTYDASALELSSVGISYVDCLGNTGNSGFQKGAGHSVQVVNGGTVSGNATIKHGSLTLTLGSDGYATSGGGISYGTYYLNSGDSVSVSAAEAASANALTTVSMSGGTLYADASTKVTATGGNIMLSTGTLSGTAKNTHVTATGGTLSVALSGTGSLNAKGTMTISGANSHTGGSIFNGGTFTLSNATSLGNGNVMTIGTNTLKANTAQTLKGAILNSGTLTLSGSWNISALALQTTAATHVDIYGHSGASGFAKSALYEVQVVLGGTSKVNNLTLTHSKLGSGLKLLLGSDGVASAGGVVDYSNYLLTDGDSADVSDILGAAGGKLDNVTMTGGNLNVDDNVVVDATGGKIAITGDSTLSGSITDTEVTLGKGSYKSDISADITGDSSLTINGGDVTLSGDNNYTGGTVINGGSLTAGDDTALGSGSITVNGGTLDLNNQELGNDITLNDGHLMGNNNYNGNLSIGGDNVSVEGGYTLGAGKVLSVAVGGTEFGSDLTLAGGTLLFEGAPLTVDGAVSFTAGTTTRVNLSQWQGRLTDGLTLAVFGSDVMGWTEGCLELIGMDGMSLGFDAATGTLTLQIAGQKPVAEVITWLGGKNTVWQHGKAGWMNASTGHDAVFETGADVIFTQSGTVTIAGAVEPGSVIVAGDKAITFKSDKKNPGRIVGETSLTKRGNGKLTLNDGNFYSGGTVIEAGTVVAGGASAFGRGDITISGGTLDLKSKAVTNDITLTGVATIKGGNKFGGELTLDGELLKGSVLNVAASAELKSGTVNGTLSGIGTVTVSGEATLGTTGKITTNALDIEGTLNVGTKGMSMNSKASSITVEKGGELQSAGLLKAYSMEVNGGEVLFNTAKATSVTLGNNLVLRNGASMNLSGKMNVGNLYMDNAQLLLRDPSGKNLAMGLTAKGNVTLGSGSALTLSGKLTAANLTLDGGALTLTSNKLQTITVKNTLTLGAAFDLNFSFNLTEGKAVKLFTFKSITGSTADLYAQLGLSDEFCTLTLNARDITLLVTDLDGLRGYMENTAKADASAAEPEEEKVSAEELLTAPQPVAAAAVDPLLRKAADTLVQSTWGTVGASRAFGDTIAARGAHATLLAEGKGAAWLSVMGGSSRISTDGERNGADFTLSGAAFGVEGRVTEKSTLGVALGNSWGKVSTFSAFPVEQDSMHIGIYGNHTLTESLTLSWMATHTRTESELNMLGLPYEWAQDALQLDARLTWATAISDKTTLRVFGGLQYLATDSGESNGLSTGSVQNLRGELGIGGSHKCSDSTLVFGELSFVGDMVRNNPSADLGGMRLRGSNPGRAGINLSVGATHRLSDDWSLNASYSFELMQNVTSHSLNVGASYSF